MTPQPMTGEEGFTLIEVLVAFTILVGAIVVSFQIYASGLKALSASETKQRLADIGRKVFAENLASGMVREGTERGSVGTLAWSIEAKPVVMDDSASGFTQRPYHVVLRVKEASGVEDMIVIDTIELLPARQ